MATDVASRGIDVQNIAHVINYDLPAIPEDFIHRVGRTGRAGLRGRASTLVAGAEVAELRVIQRALKAAHHAQAVEWRGPIRLRSPVHNTLPSRTLSAMAGEVFS